MVGEGAGGCRSRAAGQGGREEWEGEQIEGQGGKASVGEKAPGVQRAVGETGEESDPKKRKKKENLKVQMT